jgi:ligand-binding SRPBCC domain-containing protein
MPVYTFHQTLKIPSSIVLVWDFISSPQNLKHMTPDYMGFDITTKNLPEKMYAGMIISYTVSPLWGLKMRWVTEITHVSELKYFVDEQRFGPYQMWHHQHIIEPVENGVLMTDIIDYQPPLGFLGALANHLVIKNRINEIFTFRTKKLEETFGKYS